MNRELRFTVLLAAAVLIAAPSPAQRREIGSTRSSSSPPTTSAPAAPRGGGGATQPAYSSAPAAPAPAVSAAPVIIDAPVGVAYADAWAGSESESAGNEFVLWDLHTAPGSSAFDFSEANRCAADDPAADIVYVVRDDNGWIDVSRDPDIRDEGAVADAGNQPVVPAWSLNHSVQLMSGHSYLVWTWDDQMFRFTVRGISPHRVECSWTQIESDTHYATRGLARNGTSRPVFQRTKFPL